MSNESEDDFEEELEYLTMTDDDGADVEFVIIDKTESNGQNYLLVVEREEMNDEESTAFILKEVSSNQVDVTYEILDNDDEFDSIAELFAKNQDEYDVEIEE